MVDVALIRERARPTFSAPGSIQRIDGGSTQLPCPMAAAAVVQQPL